MEENGQEPTYSRLGASGPKERAPRANRSKKTLPAAFSQHAGRGSQRLDGGTGLVRLVSEGAATSLAGSGRELAGSGGASALRRGREGSLVRLVSEGGVPSSTSGGGGEGLLSDLTGNSRRCASPAPGAAVDPCQQRRPANSPERPEKVSVCSQNQLKTPEKLRLDSLVFVGACPQRHGHFAMKKMLHPPTLELFCLLELPLPGGNQQHVRAALQEWLGRWCSLQAEHPELLVAVREAFWTVPQGYPVGILCEYMPLGSLDELVHACGGLPEEAMREIAQAVLEALAVLHSAQPPMVHAYLKASQVLFNSRGRPRLTLGIAQRMKLCQVWALPGGGGAGGGDAAAGAIPGGVARGSAVEAEPEGSARADLVPEQSPAVDIFELGLLMLVCALGGLDMLRDAIPYAREFGSRSVRGPSAPLSAVFHDTCQLLQHELGQVTLSPASGNGADAGAGGDAGYLPPAADLLFNRSYSGPFLDFVSTCLEAHTREAPVTAGDLLSHGFLHEAPVGPKVSLAEMQNLARLLNEAPEADPAQFGPATTSRHALPGVAPSVAHSAQVYIMNIAQSIAPHYRATSHRGRARSPCLGEEWETLLVDTARTLGLPRDAVGSALEAQLNLLLGDSARKPSNA
mmetsp:Transcript_88184/g.175105  ORF Transcript_88184/g.175105 Transcript_88184/m.175105 type:complete len:629 (+) Transcript_88184:180-2066(+)